MTTTQTAGHIVHADRAAEQALLGCLMLDSAQIPTVAGIIGGNDFYDIRHAAIYDAILAIHATGRPAEPIIVTGHLADVGDVTRVGGASYLQECLSCVGDTRSALHHARRLREVANRRRLAELAAMAMRATETEAPSEETFAKLKQGLDAAAPRTDDEGDFVNVADMVSAEFAAIEERPHQVNHYVKSGLSDLDSMVKIQKQELVVIGARPGHGKSLLSIDYSRHAAYRQGLVVAFVSLEMSRSQLFQRILSAESGVLHDRISSGRMEDNDWAKAATASGIMGEGSLLISEKKGLTLESVVRMARKQQERGGLDLLVIDYIQLLSTTGTRKNDTRQQEIGAITRGLKALAGDLDIPIIGAAQLNRNTETRADKRPQLGDFREAGDIENDADTAILIHNWAKADPKSPRIGEADLIIAKNRSGSDGEVTVAAQMNKARFATIAR